MGLVLTRFQQSFQRLLPPRLADDIDHIFAA